jgi:hypothetical protein
LSRCSASLLSTPESDARISMLEICAIHPNGRWPGMSLARSYWRPLGNSNVGTFLVTILCSRVE